MNQAAAVFFLILSLSSPCFGATEGEIEDTRTKAQKTEEESILRGNEFVQQKEYKKAIKEYENALKMNPKSAKAHLLAGLTYANAGDLDKAIQFSQYALTIEPSFAAYNNLGLIYANKGELEKSVEMYEKALKLNPTSYRAWYQLGLVYAGKADFKKAIEAYSKTIETNPQYTLGYLGLGAAYYWSGERAKALEQVDKLKSLKKDDLAGQLSHWIEAKDSKKETNPVKPS